MRLGNGKASVLDEQVRPAMYITTQEDEAPSLLIGVWGHYWLSGRISSGRKPRVLCLHHIGCLKIEVRLCRSEGECRQQFI